ncbi:serine carboxypeptidase-like 40 [Iris pallida]|uniref:Carboxypeptidase n=1 Tax=Iris pallida TaxID=29817 RepID=A0AAX6FFR7_IRIPA|nr:serine carboxypeptidase-like 40 [Iris pallida]
MEASYLLKLLMFFFVALARTTEASEAHQLKKFVSDYRSSSSERLNSDYQSGGGGAVLVSTSEDGQMELDRIKDLPGQPEGVDFDQFSGYVTVDPHAGRALFYYFVESPQNSSSKPLVLWLNGGPGCSSLGYGAMEELGPFRVHSDGRTLNRNYYAWNNVANVIFLESPAGVSFSYSNTTSDYDTSGDTRTADDSYVFLLNWLERFPQYKTREFFVTGESYAGHYVPQLAETILRNNEIANQTVINLRGVAIGNGFVDHAGNLIGQIEFSWSHAQISDETHAAIRKECNFSSRTLSEQCRTALEIFDDEIGDIDFYNIYSPLCHHDSNSSSTTGVPNASFDPCSDDYVGVYLNNPAVQKALHSSCELITYCSGDMDGVCPITATRYFINLLRLPVKNSWRPWYLHNEVGGYVEEYDGLTLATVRGAGHLVPSDQPERALAMISSFLQGKLPPPSSS